MRSTEQLADPGLRTLHSVHLGSAHQQGCVFLKQLRNFSWHPELLTLFSAGLQHLYTG